MTTAKTRLTALLCGAAMLAGAVIPCLTDRGAAADTSVSFLEQGGLNESAYVTWAPVDGADGYNVFVDGEQIDSMLIRQYSGFFRADAVGLTSGAHSIQVVACKGSAQIGQAAQADVTVTKYDRSGFGWVNGTSSGAYNEDGTLRDGAVVLYVTDDNKDSVTCEVATGSNKSQTFTGIQQILSAVKKGYDTRPFCIRVIGDITDPAGIADVGGDLTIDGGGKFTGGMTLEGIGSDALFTGFGVKVKNISNLEIRNIGVRLCDSDEGDNITLQQGNDHVWVHNCDSFYGLAGGDADQAKGDGALDCKLSTYVTFSYNHFWDNGKCNLLGLKENTVDDLYITYHHNWYDHSDSRHPRVRFYSAHVYNNYYDGNAKYGIGSTQSSSVFAESNYFRNCGYPILTSMQGTDALGEGTFSGEDGGVVKAYGNIMEGEKSFIPYSENNTSFDAYVVENKTDKVPETVKALQTSKLGDSYPHTYNNFDTSADMYSYTADDAKDVPAIVEAGAGRLGGGDFTFAFDDAKDDADYNVNAALMDAVKSYQSGVLAVGSGFVSDTPPTPGSTSSTEATTATTASTTDTQTSSQTEPSGTTVTPAPSQSDIKVVYAGGWNEMAYIVLTGISDADVTAVSYSGASEGKLEGEDFEYLVRDTEDGLRVDLQGLKPGTYTVKIETANATVSQGGIEVNEQDRSGYAHFNYTAGVGAYNDDGTLKANAKVLYVTDENKDTVSVTSKDGTTVTGIGNILNSAGQDAGGGKTANGGTANSNSGIIKKLSEDGTPLVVRIIGTVKAPQGVTAYDSVDLGGSEGDNGFMARIKSGLNITIEGVGSGACIDGWGLHFMAESSAPDFGKSFEVRNLAFRNVPEDCVGMEGVQEGDELTAPVERCWIHNCEFYVPAISNPAESDKAQGDGACDFKRGLYFTNSYCYYEGYHKTNLVGASDSNAQYHLTYHHNYWKKCESRGPLARQANIHMYNNIFDGQTSYCMNPRANAYIFSEYNVFKDSKNPMQVKLGAIKSYNDEFTNVKGDMDGTIVTDKSEKVASDNKYANFDTDASLCYIPDGAYRLDTEADPDLYTSLSALFEVWGGTMDKLLLTTEGPVITGPGGGSGDSESSTTTTTTTTTTAPAGEALPGDLNCNGEVTIADAVLLSRLLSGATVELSEQGHINAEVDGNAGMGENDLTVLLQILVKLA